MKCLFIFAHPDDETVACAGTIKRLTDLGHEVQLVSVTDGGAGEVCDEMQPELKRLGSVSALRRHEMKQVTELLGIQECRFLDFEDGAITNQDVWGRLLSTLTDVIDEYRAELVVTFEHTGWYYHLDHVGTSIATTLAVQKAASPPEIFMHSHVDIKGSKWHYYFPTTKPITHRVNVTQLKDLKIQAILAHASQTLDLPRQWVESGVDHFELYQLISATTVGRKILQGSIFEPVAATSDQR